MSDVRIDFIVGERPVGQMGCSLETVDASKHLIPKRILNAIRRSHTDFVEIYITVESGESDKPPVKKLDSEKLVKWIYDNGYFTLSAANQLATEIDKGTFNIN